MGTAPYADLEGDVLLGPQKKRNPLVLVGTIATAGVLVAGLIAFRKGRQDLSQQMMRARVAFQGLTVALMAGSTGVYALDAEKKRNSHKTSEKLLSSGITSSVEHIKGYTVSSGRISDGTPCV